MRERERRSTPRVETGVLTRPRAEPGQRLLDGLVRQALAWPKAQVTVALPRLQQWDRAIPWERVSPLLALGGTLVLGAYLRGIFVVTSDFPLNDGGLFYAMVRDLQRAGYALPATTSYNEAGIPFAYPPLAFYLAGLLDSLTPLTLIDILRFFPLAFSLLTMLAFVGLARSLLKPGLPVIAATAAFALWLRGFNWEIVGGGLTRSPGFLFALLALHQLYLLYTRQGRRHLVLASLFSGLTVLTHLEATWFLAFSALLVFLAVGRSRRAVIDSAIVACATLALSSPWWLTVLLRHGLSPFHSATDLGFAADQGIDIGLLRLQLTEEPFFPMLRAIALLGALVCVRRRWWFLPAWVIVAFALDPRKALTWSSVPLAMMAGIGIAEVVLPAVSGRRFQLLRSPAAALTFGLILLFAAKAQLDARHPVLTTLPPTEREAMAWIAEHTPEWSRFLVISRDNWPDDRSSEWFPVLARRVSVATVQGHEWLPGFSEKIARYQEVQVCADWDGNCIEAWAQRYDVEFTYLYVAKRPPVNRGGDCCVALRNALAHDPRFEPVFENAGAVIYRHLPQPEPPDRSRRALP